MLRGWPVSAKYESASEADGDIAAKVMTSDNGEVAESIGYGNGFTVVPREVSYDYVDAWASDHYEYVSVLGGDVKVVVHSERVADGKASRGAGTYLLTAMVLSKVAASVTNCVYCGRLVRPGWPRWGQDALRSSEEGTCCGAFCAGDGGYFWCC